MILYDLAAENDEIRFSPYCWRVRFALAHKGFSPELRPWRFTEKDRIAASGQLLVPVLIDGDRVVNDSWAIAAYLDDTYPDRPALFEGPGERAVTRVLARWAESVIHPVLVRMVLLDIHRAIHPSDRDYFRQSREKRFGVRLEDHIWPRDQGLAELRKQTRPLTLALDSGQEFLAGDQPGFADHVVAGHLMFGRIFVAEPLFETTDPVGLWFERMLDQYDGLARRQRRAIDI